MSTRSTIRPLLFSALALGAAPAVVMAQAPAKALAAVSEKDLLAHIKTLASDEFEGRASAPPAPSCRWDCPVSGPAS